MFPIQPRTELRTCVLGFLLLSTWTTPGVAQVQQQKLLPSAAGSYFGTGLSVDQDRMAISDSAEEVRLYQRVGAEWVLEQVLPNPAPEGGIEFGRALSLSEGRLLVGAPDDGENGFGAGAAYLYEQTDGGWTLSTKLIGANTTIGDHFGSSVALDGDRAIVGAPWVSGQGISRGAAYIFEDTGSFLGWLQLAHLTDKEGTEHARFGHQVAIDGDLVVVSAEGDSTLEPAGGSALVYRRQSTGWVQEAKLFPEDPVPLHSYAFTVDVSGDRVVLGAHNDPEAGFSSGAVYSYRFVGEAWGLEQKILPVNPETGGRFGYKVELDGDVLAVGTQADYFGLSGAGSVEILEHGAGGWGSAQTLLPASPAQNGFYGSSIQLQGDLVAVTMPLDPAVAPFSGSVLLHSRSQFAAAYCHCDQDIPCENGAASSGCLNSSGNGGLLTAGGSGSVTADDLFLLASGLPANKAMIVCTGPGRGRAPLGDGFLCLSDLGGLRRFPVGMTDSSGEAQVGPGLVAYSESKFGPDLAITAGSTRHFQAWYRDPQGPCGNTTNLTHGLTVSFGL